MADASCFKWKDRVLSPSLGRLWGAGVTDLQPLGNPALAAQCIEIPGYVQKRASTEADAKNNPAGVVSRRRLQPFSAPPSRCPSAPLRACHRHGGPSDCSQCSRLTSDRN